jgi:hypothetical protein
VRWHLNDLVYTNDGTGVCTNKCFCTVYESVCRRCAAVVVKVMILSLSSCSWCRLSMSANHLAVLAVFSRGAYAVKALGLRLGA